MNNIRLKRIVMFILALTTLFAFSGIASASGAIAGKEYEKVMFNSELSSISNLSNTEMDAAMSPGGYLYSTGSKAVALTSPSINSYVYKVRVYPENWSSDLRINPNFTSNWVGSGQSNYSKQVSGVQTILEYMYIDEYEEDGLAIDGICGPKTIAAISWFQRYHNLTEDGIVGTNTWRALCSSRYFQYGVDIW